MKGKQRPLPVALRNVMLIKGTEAQPRFKFALHGEVEISQILRPMGGRAHVAQREEGEGEGEVSSSQHLQQGPQQQRERGAPSGAHAPLAAASQQAGAGDICTQASIL